MTDQVVKDFVVEDLNLSIGQWQVVKISYKKIGSVLPKALDQSKKKAQHSMDQGQDGQTRDKNLKIQRQLMGTLAEIAIAELLQNALIKNSLSDAWEIVRYDDVRTDNFESSELFIKGKVLLVIKITS